jgi:hypothetical protein
MEQKMNLSFGAAKLTNISEINTSFAVGSLWVMYTNDNRNASSISRDAVVDALPSLYNVPIVCHYDIASEEIGGHDIALATGSDGKKRLVNLTDPIGVVPDHAIFHFTTEEDENGVEHDYLVIENVILWKRQDAYRHIVQNMNGVIDHSMEITVFDGEEREDGFFQINRFEFTALCLLGNQEPCFEGSRLEIFSVDEFKRKMEEMMAELKDCYFSITTPQIEDDDIHPLNHETEGGNEILDEKMNLASEYGIDIESLDFSIDDYSLDELKEKFEAMKNASGTNEGTEDHDNQDSFALVCNLIEEMCRVLEAEKVTTDWGEKSHYFYIDFDPEKSEVYCWDTTDWLLYGFTYTMNGDNVIIDFESKKRVKYVIEDFDGGEQKSPFADVYAEMEQRIAEGSVIAGKYAEAEATISDMTEKMNALIEFKNSVEAEALEKEKNEVFNRFADKLSGVEAFEELRKNNDGIDVDTIEEKCYAILGRTAGAKFSIEPKTPKLPVEETKHTDETEPYGGVFVKYGITK